VQQEQELLNHNGAKLLVAMQELPVPDRFFSVATQPIVLPNAQLTEEPHAKKDCRNVAEKDITENMVPPTLAEVGHNVLQRQLHSFVKQLPEVQNKRVANNETSQKPITQVHDVVVVEIVEDVFVCKLTVIVIRVHIFCHRFVQV